MKRLLYFTLTLLAFFQNLEIQAAQKKSHTKTSRKITPIDIMHGFFTADEKIIQDCLDNNPEFLKQARDENGSNPLLSLMFGNGDDAKKIKVAKKIFEHPACNADIINHQNKYGHSLLFLLFGFPGTTDLLKIVGEKGAKFDVRDRENKNLLMEALVNQDQEAIQFLLDNFPAMLTEQDNKKLFPLHFAMKRESLDPEKNALSNQIFDLILEKTEEQVRKEGKNWSLFLNGLFVNELDQKKAHLGESTPLIHAICFGSAHCVKQLTCKPYVNPNIRSTHWCTPLFYSASKGEESSFKSLMERTDLKLDKQSKGGILPFLSFATSGKPKEALVIAQKMDPSHFKIRTDTGEDSFHYLLKYLLANSKKYEAYRELLDCITEKNPEAVNALSPNKKGKQVISPLILAACSGNVPVMIYLLEKGANIHYTDGPEIVSFLVYACQNTKDEEQFIELLEYLEHKDHQELFFKEAENGFSLLLSAITNSKKYTIEWLAKRGAFGRQRIINPLLYLTQPKQTVDGKREPSILTKEMLQSLLEAWKDASDTKSSLFNTTTQNSGNLIHYLILYSKSDFADKNRCLELLLEQPELNPNALTVEELFTPSMLLLDKLTRDRTSDCIETLKILLEHPRTDVSLCNLNGDTILHMATQTDIPEVFQLVSEACSKKCPAIFKKRNNQEMTYKDYIQPGGSLESGGELVREEKEREKAAQKRKAIIQKLSQKFLEELEADIAQEEQEAKDAEATEDKAATAASCSAPQQDKFNCSYTRTLKMWRRMSEILETKSDSKIKAALETLLLRDGYFSDPVKETDPIRRTRATIYQNLKAMLCTTHPGEDEETINELVVLKIAKEHGFPDFIIRTLINNHPDMQRNLTEKTDFECRVTTATYEDSEGIHTGTYELYGKIFPGKRVEIHHALFRETAMTAKPKVSKKIPAATKGSEATGTASASACAADDFTSRDKFIEKITELPDKAIHTITDKQTGTVYTLEILK